MIILLCVCMGTLVAAVVLYLRNHYSKFEKYGVKTHKPVLILGNLDKVILRKEHYANNIRDYYKAFPKEKFVGRFEFISDLVLVRDLDLIKKITVKDFDHFVDHRTMLSYKESFFSRNLIVLKGQEWKDMRSSLSPAFTSSKIRHMVPLMVEVGDQLIANMKKAIESSQDGYIDYECKDLTSRYTNDVIASCAFGLKVDSLKDRDNEFYTTGKISTAIGYRKMLTMFFVLNAPKIANFLKMDFISKTTSDFFRYLVLDTMKTRELHQILRPDMIHLLMELKKGQLKHEDQNDNTTGFATAEESSMGTRNVDRVWSDNDLISQAMLFFLAGYDTISTVSIFLLYELAINPDVQDKLAEEIKENAIKNHNKFDFKSIQEMQYLDMVISEVLRKWPPLAALDRLCIKDYNVGKPNDDATQDYIIRKNTAVTIPVLGIHYDPQYYPNPEKFDPERFSEENKYKINPLAYMPFGAGPRNCLGSRFALAELKVLTYHILLHFDVSPCEKTCIPAELNIDALNMELKGGNWLRFILRQQGQS